MVLRRAVIGCLVGRWSGRVSVLMITRKKVFGDARVVIRVSRLGRIACVRIGGNMFGIERGVLARWYENEPLGLGSERVSWMLSKD